MGIGFVLLIWAVVGTVLAVIGALVLASAAALLTRGAGNGRRRAIIAAGLFPFACLAWGGSMFFFQALVNEGLLHRDPGAGDAWKTPLPNGYAILMIDVTDQGWVYNPKTQGSDSAVGEQEDAVAGVRNVQIAGHYILGGVDSKAFQGLGKDSHQVDSYFLLDTQTGKRTQFQDYNALRRAAVALNIAPNLQPINDVYGKYRFTWFEVFAGLLFILPPIAGALLLLGWIIRLRRRRRTLPQPA